jgi:hypothetical protein
MLIFKYLFLAYALLYNAVMTIVGMCSNKGIMYQPPYLAYHKILHFLEETIVFIFQHSLLIIYLQSSMMPTSLSEIVLFVENISGGLVPTLYVVWHVVLRISCHAALTQAVISQKALIMAPVRI